jgi:ribosomal protein S18 acetylase RimI-like enzyme
MSAPRPAVPTDIPELIRLRVVMLTSLGRDPGPEDAAWRPVAAEWFQQRLARPEDWVFRVVGPEGGVLQACGAGWLTEHLPGPRAPLGLRGHIGFICTDVDARRQGHARRILSELIEWFTPRGVARLELRASADGQALYRSAGFVVDDGAAMYRSIG